MLVRTEVSEETTNYQVSSQEIEKNKSKWEKQGVSKFPVKI